MRHTDAVLLDGPKDGQMYQIPVEDAGMWIGTLENPMNLNEWAGGSWTREEGQSALATSLESFIEEGVCDSPG